MTNSVSFSSGLNTLFLIEETQVVAFPLASKKGILISKVEEQLVAATFQGTINKRRTQVIQIETDKSQIQFYYSDQLDQAFIIIIEAEFNKNKERINSYTYRNLNFDLNSMTIVVKRVENTLTFYSFPKKKPTTLPDPSDIG